MTVLLICSLGLLFYVYAGYPALLWLLVRVRGARAVRKADVTPPLTLVISAYNEASVIRRKLENALALDYPPALRQIVVVSDASDDGTDEIVEEYAARGVTLARQTERRGKTEGLNRTVPTLTGEVVVFSDANAMYERDALLKLVRNFADPQVGCVTGEARYLLGGSTAADVGERAYWNYEIRIKRYETALGSMAGGDGAIYAIRRLLWRQLPPDAINDFLNPLQIVAAGWRGVYEPEAVCYEETAGGMRTEYRRRVRIVSRSWRAVFQAGHVLNPARVGLFAWALVSHKMLRWWSGVFGGLAVIAAVVVVEQEVVRRPGVAVGLVAVIVVVLTLTTAGRRLSAMFAYFALINAASIVGVAKGSVGRVSGVWATPRAVSTAEARRQVLLIPVGRLLQMIGGVVVIALAIAYRSMPNLQMAAIVFWTSGAVLAYIYIGYPVLLALMRQVGTRPVQRAGIEPSVCVFITANDEAAVIRAKLENTLALDYAADRLEIVVASDGSVDGTNEIVRQFVPRVRLLEFFPRRGKIVALNAGMAAVASDIVVFSDANTFLESDAIRALVRNFADRQVGAVSGDVVLTGDRALLGRSEDLYYRYERWVQRAESELGSMISADGALYAIRRHLFSPPPDDTVLDDMAIPMAVIRAGYRVVYEPSARAFERGSETAKEEFARKSRVIAGAMQFMNRRDSAVPLGRPQVILSLISHKGLRWISPVFALCTLVASLALADPSRVYGVAVAIQLGLLALGILGCIPALRRTTVVALAHYFCLVQAAAAVGFVKGLTGRQSVLWRRFERAGSPEPAATPKMIEPSMRVNQSNTPWRGFRAATAPFAKTALLRTGCCAAIRRVLPRRRLAILRYHAICGPEGYGYADPSICITPENFEHHVAYLTRSYSVLRLDDAVRTLADGHRLPRNAVVITFDDGYADNLAAARTVAKYGASATFYITAGCLADGQPFWPSELRHLVHNVPRTRVTLSTGASEFEIDLSSDSARAAAVRRLTKTFKSHPIPVRDALREQLRGLARGPAMPRVMLTWDEVREMHALGMTIGSHTMTHPNLPNAGVQAAREELIASRQRLQREIGVPITMFSYPNGGAERYMTRELQEVVREAGYAAGATSRNAFAGKESNLYALERIEVQERIEDLIFALELERFVLRPVPRTGEIS